MFDREEPLSTRHMTAEDVLAVFKNWYEHQVSCGDILEADAPLSFDTSVHHWRETEDLFPWRKLGESLDACFGTTFTKDQWRQVLTPAKERTLRDVCELIASQARAPKIEPLTFAGRPCRPAGAFMLVRTLLSRAGADVAGLRPSTPLASYALDHTDTFMNEIIRAAPGRLPPVQVFDPLYTVSRTGFLVSWLIAMVTILTWGPVSCCIGPWSGSAAGSVDVTRLGQAIFTSSVAGLIGFYCLLWVDCRRKPRSVKFGDLRTFRDLCYALVNEEQRKTRNAL